MIKIIIIALAAVFGFSGGSNKADNIKIYDYSFSCPTMIEFYQGRTNQLKIENEKMIEENAKRIKRNEKIIEVLEKYGYSEK